MAGRLDVVVTRRPACPQYYWGNVNQFVATAV
jgi:hypothetical protein